MIGMLECFTVKTHPILMKFKRRNVYLWIKVHKDLLLTLSEILTAFLFFFFFQERKRVQGKEILHVLYIVAVSGSMFPADRQKAPGSFDTRWVQMIYIQLKFEDKVASKRLPLVKGQRCADSPSQLQGDVSTRLHISLFGAQLCCCSNSVTSF